MPTHFAQHTDFIRLVRTSLKCSRFSNDLNFNFTDKTMAHCTHPLHCTLSVKIKKENIPSLIRNENEKLLHEAFKEFVIDFCSIFAILAKCFSNFLENISEFCSFSFWFWPCHDLTFLCQHTHRHTAFSLNENFNFSVPFSFPESFFCLFPFQVSLSLSLPQNPVPFPIFRSLFVPTSSECITRYAVDRLVL